jgi:hypothetical protein
MVPNEKPESKHIQTPPFATSAGSVQISAYLLLVGDLVVLQLADHIVMFLIILRDLLPVILQQFPGRPQLTYKYKLL